VDINLRARIYNNLALKETEELQEIWQNQNTDEWNPEVFPIIQEILQARLGHAPPQSTQTQARQFLSEVEGYFQTGEWNQALHRCDQVIEMMPDYILAYYYRGQVYETLGRPVKAIADYQVAIRLDPELKLAWRSMRNVEAQLEEEFLQSCARKHLDQALEYLDQDEPQRAQEECDQARATLPGIAIAYNYLGLVLQASGQYQPAIDAYLESVRLNPRFYAARENLRSARVGMEEEHYHLAAFENRYDTLEETGENFDFDESQASEIPESVDPLPGWLYLDECAYLLAGWPGHRTRPGRSGYDPLDADFENAYMHGLMFRLSFSRKLRTRHPFYLFLMACFGMMFCLPLLFVGISFIHGDWAAFPVLIFSSPFWMLGLALWVNVYLSLGLNKSDEGDENGSTFF